jgi:hypothetical protein
MLLSTDGKSLYYFQSRIPDPHPVPALFPCRNRELKKRTGQIWSWLPVGTGFTTKDDQQKKVAAGSSQTAKNIHDQVTYKAFFDTHGMISILIYLHV